jgi:Fe-Mn family superoxide dismutase
MEQSHSRRDVLAAGGAAAVLAAAGNAVAQPRDGAAAAESKDVCLPGAVLGGKYALPPLPYGYDALAPLYEERMLKVHHDAHHAAYVKGLNDTLDKLAAARTANDFAAVQAMSNALSFHGSGHMLHSLFWHSMASGGKASDEMAKALAASFGSADAAKAQFASAAKAVEGSGWAVLAYEPIAGKLLILQSEKHQNLAVWGAMPLLVCDVWEHAYYLQYQNKRADWVEAFMKLANWEFAAHRLAWAKKLACGG